MTDHNGRIGLRRIVRSWSSLRRPRGQATTEVVLLMPLFMFFLFAFAKMFAVLVLVQKLEIASFYAARRWQLESHRNVSHEGFDDNTLKPNIEDRVNEYLGTKAAVGGPLYTTSVASFLGVQGKATLNVTRTQVWQVVKLTINTKPIDTPVFKYKGLTFEATKYVPNRDRPIAFILPGLKK